MSFYACMLQVGGDPCIFWRFEAGKAMTPLEGINYKL